MSIEEVWNKEVHTKRVKRLEKQSGVTKYFQRTSTEDWGLYNENNQFSKMTTSKQWNYGDVLSGILTIIKKGIIIYEKSARSSFDYAFEHHSQARLLCNDLLTKTIYFLRELVTVVEDLYHCLCLKCFSYQSCNKAAKGHVL